MELTRIGLETLETDTEGGAEGVRVEGNGTAKFHFGVLANDGLRKHKIPKINSSKY
jgi:hypothetical protein